MRRRMRSLWIKWRLRTGVPFRVVVATAAAAALILEGVVGFGAWTTAPTWLLISLVVFLALVGLRDNLREIARRRRAKEEHEQRDEVSKYLAAAMLNVTKIIGVPTEQLGMSVFLVRKAPPVVGEAYLHRYRRYRFVDFPAPSGVDWTIGKGAIGECWRTMDWALTDWDDIRSRHQLHLAAGRVDEALWATIPEDDRHGLSREEFSRIHCKYGEVLAVPMVVEGTFLGCVALDRTMDSTPHVSGPALSRADVRTIIEEAAVFVSRTLT